MSSRKRGGNGIPGIQLGEWQYVVKMEHIPTVVASVSSQLIKVDR